MQEVDSPCNHGTLFPGSFPVLWLVIAHGTGHEKEKRFGGVEPMRSLGPDLFVNEKKVGFEWKLCQGVFVADNATHHTKWRLVTLLKNQVPWVPR
jgi:hypothetical protein